MRRRESFDRTLRSDRHENGSLDRPVWCVEKARSRTGFGALGQNFKLDTAFGCQRVVCLLL